MDSFPPAKYYDCVLLAVNFGAPSNTSANDCVGAETKFPKRLVLLHAAW
jgi:hypothetical protein